tara:strand:+ start:113 stop:970 length:858 start_codon:yes stop_codon:yes gene_type:complete
MIKTFKYFIQSIFIYSFYFFGRILGLRVSRKLFSFLFVKFGPLFKSKNIIDSNLENFSKNLLSEEKSKIIEDMWSNYGMTFIEYVFLNFFKKNNSHIKIKGENILKDVINEKKKVIFVSGHFANFELMSMEIVKQNIKLATIYRPLNNLFLNPLMELLRKKFVCSNQIKKGINGVRETIEYVNKGYNIALMIDQRVSEGEKINFFNKPALTTTLPAQLSIKYNMPIIPVFIKRKSDNLFELEFFDEIKPNEFKNKIELTNKLNSILENLIKKFPNQWIWTHNRWK